MNKLEFETERHRIGKAFGRPPIAPAPVVIEVAANQPSPWGEPRVHAPRPPRNVSAGWAGIAGLCAIGLVAVLVWAPASPFKSGKTLRCEITTTMSTDIHDARQPVIYEKPSTMTMTLRIVSNNQWQALSVDGMDVDALAHQNQVPVPEHPVLQPLRTTDQFYIVQDSANVPNPYNAKLLESDFMSIDRATGAVTGKMHLHSEDSNIDTDDVKTGHCTPVGGSVL